MAQQNARQAAIALQANQNQFNVRPTPHIHAPAQKVPMNVFHAVLEPIATKPSQNAQPVLWAITAKTDKKKNVPPDNITTKPDKAVAKNAQVEHIMPKPDKPNAPNAPISMTTWQPNTQPDGMPAKVTLK